MRKISKRLGKPEKINIVQQFMFTQSENPKILEIIRTVWVVLLITKSFRITFDIDYENRIIDLLSIGDHKQTYVRTNITNHGQVKKFLSRITTMPML